MPLPEDITKKWFPGQLLQASPKGYMILFHSAGSDSGMYTARYIQKKQVGNELLDFCKSRSLQFLAPVLPGRSYNYANTLSGHSLESLADKIFDLVVSACPSILSSVPVFLLGHSLGCFFAFEFARKFVLTYKKSPKLIFLSSSISPSIPVQDRPWKLEASMDDEELRLHMMKWDMRPEGLAPQMWRSFCGIIRADLRLMDNYPCRDCQVDDQLTTDLRLVLVRGQLDRMISRTHMEAWKGCLPQSEVSYHEIEGGSHALYYEETSRRFCFNLFAGVASEVLEEERSSSDDDEVHGF